MDTRILLAIPPCSSITTLAIFFPFQPTLLLNIAWGYCVLLGYSHVDSDCKRNYCFCPFWVQAVLSEQLILWAPFPFCSIRPNRMSFLVFSSSLLSLVHCEPSAVPVVCSVCLRIVRGFTWATENPVISLEDQLSWLLSLSIPVVVPRTPPVWQHSSCTTKNTMCLSSYHLPIVVLPDSWIKTSTHGKTTGLFCFYSFYCFGFCFLFFVFLTNICRRSWTMESWFMMSKELRPS